MLVFSCIATGAVNVQVIEGKKTEFVLEGCSRFFNEASVPKIVYPDEDGALTLAFTRGEIDLQDLSANLYRSKGILFETCAPQNHSEHGKVERVIRSLQQSFSRSGAMSCRLTATGWVTVAKAIERDVNSIPIGFLFDKSSKDGNPILRILRPCSLKGMNASDRAPSGLFTVPDLPEKHFNKVREAYDLWAKCWTTSYLPLVIQGQKWHQGEPSLNINDVVYFKIKESPLKAEWRTGKVDNIKLGRDGKIRQVNVAYKVFKENSNEWSHHVVSRPIREIVKLYEVSDTTYAEEMIAVQKAAKKILSNRGALVESLNDTLTVSSPNVELSGSSISLNVFSHHEAFINYVNTDDGCGEQLCTDGYEEFFSFESDAYGDVKSSNREEDLNEKLFLI